MQVPDIFNNPMYQNLFDGAGQPANTGSFTSSGTPYSGPFANDTRTPFRTVSGIGQYGNGLNASAGQLYEHFSGAQNANGRKYSDHGLKPINPKTQLQTLEDFASRGMPQGGENTGDQGGYEWGSLNNNNDVLAFMRQNNALGGDALEWMGKWFGESGIGSGKDFLTGNVRHWDYMNSDLTDQNKGIVGNAMNYLNQYWSPIEQGKGMPADPPAPKMPTAANMGGIFNIDPAMLKQIMRTQS